MIMSGYKFMRTYLSSIQVFQLRIKNVTSKMDILRKLDILFIYKTAIETCLVNFSETCSSYYIFHNNLRRHFSLQGWCQ